MNTENRAAEQQDNPLSPLTKGELKGVVATVILDHRTTVLLLYCSTVLLLCLSYFVLPHFFTCRLYAQQVNVNAEIRNLKSRDSDRKLSAIQKLGDAEDETATEALADALKSEKDSFTRIQIMDSIDVANSTAAAQAVMSSLDDNDPEIRKKAILSLTRSGDSESVIRKLGQMLPDEKDRGVKLAIVSVLRSYSLNSDEAITILGTQLIKDEDASVRIAAVRALKLWKGELAGRYLAEALKTEKDSSVIDEIRK